MHEVENYYRYSVVRVVEPPHTLSTLAHCRHGHSHSAAPQAILILLHRFFLGGTSPASLHLGLDEDAQAEPVHRVGVLEAHPGALEAEIITGVGRVQADGGAATGGAAQCSQLGPTACGFAHLARDIAQSGALDVAAVVVLALGEFVAGRGDRGLGAGLTIWEGGGGP